MLTPFHELFPDVATREVRTVRLEGDGQPGAIPAGEYAFIESYCTDPACDCERVLISVTERERGIVATISYGFNPSKLPPYLDQQNPFLDPLNPQSKYAEEILSLFKEIVLDEEFEARLQRHYRLVKWALGPEGYRPAQSVSGLAAQRGANGKLKRKQQKAARRKNRRR